MQVQASSAEQGPEALVKITRIVDEKDARFVAKSVMHTDTWLHNVEHATASVGRLVVGELPYAATMVLSSARDEVAQLMMVRVLHSMRLTLTCC
jgi:hypothetical protein